MIRNVLRTIPLTLQAPRHGHRRFSTLMDTSNFTELQLTVREAISKICSKFPDVRISSRAHATRRFDRRNP